jgi:hypothetical protein
MWDAIAKLPSPEQANSNPTACASSVTTTAPLSPGWATTPPLVLVHAVYVAMTLQ